ncbi:MAG: hypothetical protein ACREAC_17305, partial [Blastocatellia bacterium]
MAWQIHRVVFRVRSPLHIGWGKVGNLQRTRPYVTGRAMWGALTMRLTRDAANGGSAAANSRDYQQVGLEVHRSMAFSYFYPAVSSVSEYEIAWPWLDEARFGRQFLSSYGGTALSYPSQSSATGMLHEVEFITPTTLDCGLPVFLVGYILEEQGCALRWREALRRFQIGGERGYGWGDTELVEAERTDDRVLF